MKQLAIAMCSMSFLASGTFAENAKDVKNETYGMGQPFALGDYTYTVTKFEAKRKIGQTYHNKEAEDGAKFMVVYYSIRNNTKETQTVRSDDFKVTDEQQRSFSPYSGGSLYLGSDFLLSQLQPGLTKKTATVFELPDDAFAGPLKLVIPEKGSIFKKKGNAVVELVKAGPANAQPPAPKVTEKQATSQAEQPEQEGDKPSPTLSATEAGKKDGTRYGHQLVGQWYVRKNETRKTPDFKPLSSQKMTEQWIAYAAKTGYKTSSEQAAYTTAKKQAVDETFRKGTGTKLKWD